MNELYKVSYSIAVLYSDGMISYNTMESAVRDASKAMYVDYSVVRKEVDHQFDALESMESLPEVVVDDEHLARLWHNRGE